MLLARLAQTLAPPAAPEAQRKLTNRRLQLVSHPCAAQLGGKFLLILVGQDQYVDPASVLIR